MSTATVDTLEGASPEALDGMPQRPVAIVGGGPVGLMLALFLDRHGVATVVFNLERDSRWHPKGSTHNARTMEHYRRLGIADAVRGLGLPVDHPRDIAYFTRLAGWELTRLAMGTERERARVAQEAGERDQEPEPLLRANQMYVERFLLAHAGTRANITLRYGWRVTGFEQDAAGVTLAAEPADGGAPGERWRASYLVGCDGGQSFVRRTLGIAYEGPGGAHDGFLGGRMFSSYVRIPALDGELLRGRKAWMYNVMAPGARMLLVSLNGGDEFLLMSKPDAQEREPDDATVIRRIQNGVGRKVDVEVIAHVPWQGGVALVAQRFSSGRAFLAGDATHLFSPTGGFGMNTGIDGAANLAWKLAAALEGWAGEGLLASYEAERRPIAYRNTAAARFLTFQVGDLRVPVEVESDDAAGEAVRRELGEKLQAFRPQFESPGVELGARYDGSPIVWPDGVPPEDDPLVYRPSGVPGGRLPHVWLTGEDGARRSVFDLLGLGFTLLRVRSRGAEADPQADDGGARLGAAARARGVPLSIVELESDAAFELYARRLVLVRPDQHVAWRGDGVPADAGVVLDRVIGRVTSTCGRRAGESDESGEETVSPSMAGAAR
ncbi:FAD-dependent monooxygenase [Burkholderia sp. FERM BP-3421]|uniref:FAD-dependent monooxygenase n=1 Tax=Burkholderia sp. FERM BP-3421 TaxID=1494466 RepID=UPI0023600094|nr:FAD-dependent monooxygenase [Burkholderia sp. FERM BP-3421]WDD92871.1 FAD-dependent monooxygenase [Burkholderia sp. FERM BP-3421]